MSENSATKTLRNNLKKLGAHVQRFEDKLTPGIPDTNFCLEAREVWLEGKFLRSLPSREDTLVRFGARNEPRLAHQRNWMTARHNAGSFVRWWLRVQDVGWWLFDDFDVIRDGIPKRDLRAMPRYANSQLMIDAVVREATEHYSRINL